MLFNSIDFVIFFTVVLTTITIIKNRKFQHLFILFASYFFFYYSSNYYITLLIFTTLWDYYLGKAIWNANSLVRKKGLLILSLSANLTLLGFFKYADFAIVQFNILGHDINLNTNIPLLHIALPIGISFYTFHSIGYIIDIYRRHAEPSRSLREYAIFISFFPQLVAGPILRAQQFLPQLREKMDQFGSGTKLRQILITNSNLKLGVTMMALGFFKKMFIADNISPLVNTIFANPLGKESFTIVLGAIGFGIQIYSDFSGYSDIAIGAALVMGFKLPANFNKPYFAISPSDFWKRWHISLSSWLRDYLYIPLGGNRISKTRTYFNLFATMFLGGLWHGASWNFIIWGMLHGSYLAFHKLITHRFPMLGNHTFFKTRMGVFVSIFVTQYLVFLTWIAFRVRNTDYMIYSMKKYIILDFHIKDTLHVISANKVALGVMILFVILHLISYKKGNIIERIAGFKLPIWFLFLTGIMSLILLFVAGNTDDFIYFQF